MNVFRHIPPLENEKSLIEFDPKDFVDVHQRQWREKLLNRLLLGFLAVGIPFLGFAILSRPITYTIAPGFGVCLALALVSQRQISFNLRAGLFCFILFMAGVNTLSLAGVDSAARLYLGASIVVGTVFFGTPIGLYMLVAGCLLIMSFGGFQVVLREAEPSDWMMYFSGFLLVWGIVQVATSALIKKTGELIHDLESQVEDKMALEETAKQDLERLEFITANTTDVIWMMDLDLNYTYVSPGIETLRGYTPEEVLALGDANFAPGAREFLKKVLSQRLEWDEGQERENPLILETSMRHRDGHLIDIEVTARFVRDESNRPVGVIGSTRDVTDRKRLERSMELVIRGTQRMQGADFLDSMTRNLAEALDVRCVMIGEFGEGRKVQTLSVWMDSEQQENFTYSLEGTPCSNVLRQKDFCSYPSKVRQQFPNDDLLIEMQMEAYLGTPLYDVEGGAIGILVAMHGTPIEKVGFCEDMLTIFAAHAGAELSRRRMEADTESIRQQLVQAQKLDSIGQLAGGIAHDFNNLLVVIRGANFMARKMSEDRPEMARYFEQIQESADRATDLTRQILSFGRRQILDTKLISLNSLLLDLQKMLPRLLPENIHVEHSLDESTRTIEADPTQIEQVVINLAINARDSMADGGHLFIETSNSIIDDEFVEIRPWARRGEYVVLTVRDDGTGMTKEVQERMFDPFFTTKPEGQGTELGLSVLFGVIKQHNGFVVVESELGEGTEIRIYLPAVDAEVEAVETPPSVDVWKQEVGNKTLLLVEDEHEVRKLAKEFLETAGYTVIDCPDGKSAIEQFDRHKGEIAIALLDVVLPDLNGRQVMEKLRATSADLPILFMTGHTAGGIHDDFILEKDLELLRKPYEPEEMLARVGAILAAAGSRESTELPVDETTG